MFTDLLNLYTWCDVLWIRRAIYWRFLRNGIPFKINKVPFKQPSNTVHL